MDHPHGKPRRVRRGSAHSTRNPAPSGHRDSALPIGNPAPSGRGGSFALLAVAFRPPRPCPSLAETTRSEPCLMVRPCPPTSTSLSVRLRSLSGQIQKSHHRLYRALE